MLLELTLILTVAITLHRTTMHANRREPSHAFRVAAALTLVFSSSCSTFITKTNAPMWPGRRHAASGLGHPFTGIRCEPLYFVGFAMYPPTLPVVPFVVVDTPLSAIADILLLPADIAVGAQKGWEPDRDCGINLH